MKKLILALWLGGGLFTAQAQLFGPEAWGGAFWGSIIGGIAGSGGHCFSGTGAAIGAGVGFVAGAITGEVRRQEYCARQPYAYYPYPAPYPYANPYYPAPGYYSYPVQPQEGAQPAPQTSYGTP